MISRLRKLTEARGYLEPYAFECHCIKHCRFFHKICFPAEALLFYTSINGSLMTGVYINIYWRMCSHFRLVISVSGANLSIGALLA